MSPGPRYDLEEYITSVAALAHVNTRHIYGVDAVLWETMEDRTMMVFGEMPPLVLEDAEIFLKWREITLIKAREVRRNRFGGKAATKSLIEKEPLKH